MPRQATSEGWYRSLAAVIAAVVAVLVPVMRTASAEPQGESVSAAAAGEAPATMPSGFGPGGLQNSTIRSRSRWLYHFDVTKEGVPCKRNPLLDLEVDPANYEFGCRDIKIMLEGKKTLVGSGSVRDVFLVEYEGQTVVVKSLRRKDDPNVEKHRLVMHKLEVLTLDALRGNRNIVGMLGVCGTTVVTEYFPTNVVYYAFQSRERLSIHAVVSMSLDAARGLQALHEVGCVHVDLKPMQLLVDDNRRVMVNDFNSVHVMGISPTDGAFCPVRAKKRNRLEAWPSPENYAGQPLTETSDIYSMAMVFYSLLSGTPPFGGPEGLAEAFATRTQPRPLVDPSWHRGYVQIVQDMWNEDPMRRPSARQIVARLEIIEEDLGP
ncbi:similar to TAK1 (TGF-beta-activated kinase) [Ectocarpus siliculosus]|uniref:Similar to TAK1 (TGF-beta-activated kinase) n=1 Tax=Ectocarpus siliculosus TaxID=2880 RepID=D7FYC9_ECTSI|nr:similar to TAK1 (TGF-beta-activated kinase) [Ectocarpus siliculosus]|eukprot:CBJ32471.1 similar to TAK1 (TGF-beta-activated kinase) [Ectocarpus siliculosus]